MFIFYYYFALRNNLLSDAGGHFIPSTDHVSPF